VILTGRNPVLDSHVCCLILQRKTGPVTAVYEARAMPKDHKVGDPSKTFREIGGY